MKETSKNEKMETTESVESGSLPLFDLILINWVPDDNETMAC